MPATWKELYDTTVIGVYALLVVPVLFLARLAIRRFVSGPGIEPYAARFVRIWTIAFALASIADPIATGLLGWPLMPWVLLGDYRVFALVLTVMEPGRARASALVEAVAWTLPVPLVAYATLRAMSLVAGEPPAATLWIVYETSFALLTIFVMARVVPRRVGVERASVRGYVRAVLGCVFAYYALWVTSDVLVLTGRDVGWGLRVVPNLLYYGAFVPFAYFRFFSPGAR